MRSRVFLVILVATWAVGWIAAQSTDISSNINRDTFQLPGGPGADDEDSLVFDGLTHTPTAAAELDERLVISNIGSSGEDGVSIDIGPTRFWDADALTVVPTSLDWSTTFTAVGERDGVPVAPSLIISEVMSDLNPSTSHLLEFRPAFGSSTYSIEITNGSTPVFSATGFLSGSGATLSGNDAICDALGKANSVALGICEWVTNPTFQQNDNGECEWEITRSSVLPFFVDGTLVGMGDRVRFVEEISSFPGEAVFHEMRIQASNVSEITIDGESVGDDEHECVSVCHVPPGNPSNAHTICVGESAVDAHLGHGDTLGPCEDD